LLRRSESLEPLGEIIPMRAERLAPWDMDTGLVDLLEPMAKHGAVDLFEHISTKMDDVVRVHAEDIDVVGTVVNPAE
jgi:hypothetical protein